MTQQAAAQWIAPGKLVPWGNNPRHNQHAVQSIADSIERFGFASPIVARRADLRVIAGHTRLQAALKLGMDQVPVRLLDVSESEADALALADNKLGEIAEWDEDALSAVLADLQGLDVELDGLGWAVEDMDELLNEISKDSDAPPPGAGDLGMNLVSPKFAVLVECQDEEDQRAIFEAVEAIAGEHKIRTLVI